MVYYFTATYVKNEDENPFASTTPTEESYTLLMGEDKFENEHLIAYGWPEDVWFHVDDLSSAHVYLRLQEGMTLDDIPESIVTDCAALVKANSIQGCKMSEVYVVYTRWKNLKKTSNMVEGQVGFHRPQNVRRIKIEKHNDRVKRLNKTKRHVPGTAASLQEAQQKRLDQIQRQKKQHYKEQQKIKQQEELAAKQEKELRSYDRLFQDSNRMTAVSEQQATADSRAAEAYEDDFF
jgi:hypothetical protein